MLITKQINFNTDRNGTPGRNCGRGLNKRISKVTYRL